MRALVRLNLHAEQREPRKKTVDCAERAEKAAERAINKHAGGENRNHDDELAREENVEHGEFIGVRRVGKQADRAFERPCRTDILAKRRDGEALRGVNQRHGYDEYAENDILQPAERAGDAAFLNFGRGELMKQLLKQPERAEPAADRAPQRRPEEQQNAQQVKRRARSGRGERVLQRAKRTRADCTGAGITMKSGHADVFERAGIDIAFEKALRVGVIKQGGVNLDEPPPGGACAPPTMR